jgi:hypothetical protein
MIDGAQIAESPGECENPDGWFREQGIRSVVWHEIDSSMCILRGIAGAERKRRAGGLSPLSVKTGHDIPYE